MKLSLIFPPGANPSYIPLGVSVLSSYLRQISGNTHVTVLDLNIETWDYLSRLDQTGIKVARFMRGQDSGFYDEEKYLASLHETGLLTRRMKTLEMEIRKYVDTGELHSLPGKLLDEHIEKIISSSPDIVGISVLFPSQFIFGLALARRLDMVYRKQHSVFPVQGKNTVLRPSILLGGASLSAVNIRELLMACPYIDGAIPGEGEQAFTEFCNQTSQGYVPGLITRAGRHLVKCPVNAPLDSAQFAPADYSHFNFSRYFLPEPVLPVQYSRGCPWNRCKFCSHNFSYQGYRKRPMEHLVDELENHVREYGVTKFYFADEIIRAKDLRIMAESIIQRGLDIHFHVLAKPVPQFDAALLELLSRAGCRWISWGVESGSQRLLDAAGKGFRISHVPDILAKSYAAGISNLVMMIFGLPGSNDHDLRHTFNLLEDIWPSIDGLTTSSFVLFADTPFGQNPKHFNLHVINREILFSAGGNPVHSKRLFFRELSADGKPVAPRGPMEVALWEQHRRWIGELSIYDSLCAEHYLLYASRRHCENHINIQSS